MPYGIIQQQIMQVEICIAVVFITSQTYYFFVIIFKIISTYQKRTDVAWQGTNKKAHLESDGLYFLKNLMPGLTYLSRFFGVELAPFIRLLNVAGCQGFIGPLPSAFLDKCCKKRTEAKLRTKR